jgi:hypothetical protein
LGQRSALVRHGQVLTVYASDGSKDSIAIQFPRWHLYLCANDAVPRELDMGRYLDSAARNAATDTGKIKALQGITYRTIRGAGQLWYLDNQGFFTVQMLRQKGRP